MNYNTTEKSKNQAELLEKYKQKKIRNEKLINYIVTHASASLVQRMEICGEFLAMISDKDGTKKKLASGNFCGNRFCPMCSWREAKKDALKIDILMRHIEDVHDKAFIFITLTAPNVKGSELKAELNKFNAAFKKLTKRKEVAAMNKGYIRKLEITYNQKREDYHPHFHIIMAVNKSYFKDRTYIKARKWLNLWQEVMQDETITQVKTQRVKRDKDELETALDAKPDNSGITSSSAQNEIAKYMAKDDDMTTSQEVFDTFYLALKGRQIITYNGLFAESNKLYKAKKLDSYKTADDTQYLYMLLYQWQKGDYITKEARLLTDAERQRYNNELIEEIEDID